MTDDHARDLKKYDEATPQKKREMYLNALRAAEHWHRCLSRDGSGFSHLADRVSELKDEVYDLTEQLSGKHAWHESDLTHVAVGGGYSVLVPPKVAPASSLLSGWTRLMSNKREELEK